MAPRGKIFGIGWAKTGTTSLGRALEVLGWRHCGYRKDLAVNLAQGKTDVIWGQVASADAFEDLPWSMLYPEAAKRYPDARFILTTRPTDTWLTSYRKMTLRQGDDDPDRRRVREFVYGFDPTMATDAELIARVERHNDAVKVFFSDGPERLLCVSWECGDSWPALCAFLNVAVPMMPFPHENRAPS